MGIGLADWPVSVRAQAFTDQITLGRTLMTTVWGSALPLVPTPGWKWSPLLGFIKGFNIDPSVQGGWDQMWPRPMVGLTWQWASGSHWWMRFSPSVTVEASGNTAGTIFLNSSLLAGPPLFELGYQFTPHLGLRVGTSLATPIKLYWIF